VKTVITCPISKITLCADFMARETQGCRAIRRDCRYFQHVDCRIVWNLPEDPRLLWNQTNSLILKIRAGYDIAFNCIQQVLMLLMLSVHPSRRSDLLSDDKIEFSPKGQARNFKDAFGNICSRLVAESTVELPPVSLESRHAVSHALNRRPRMLRASTGQHAGLNMSLLRRHRAAPPNDPKTWSAFGTVHVRLPFLRTGRNKGSS
jgi:hypothetical protein